MSLSKVLVKLGWQHCVHKRIITIIKLFSEPTEKQTKEKKDNYSL